MNKEDALEHIVTLAKKYHIKSKDILSALENETVSSQSTSSDEPSNWINILYIYMGAILIFAGIYTLIAMKWPSFNIVERVTITLGFGFSAFILGFISLKYPYYKKASTPLFLIALCLEPAGVIILLQKYSFIMPIWGIIILAIVYSIQQRLAILSEKPSILIIMTLVFGAILFGGATDNNSIILNLGFGFFIFNLGLYYQNKPIQISTILFLVGAILEASGLLSLLSLHSSILIPTWGILIVSFILFLQYGVAFISNKLSILAFLTLVFLYSFFLAALELFGVPERLKWFVLSSSLLCVSIFIKHSKNQGIAGLLFFISSLVLLIITFDIVHNKPYEILYLGLSSVLIYLAIIENSRVLLLNASIATLCFILYYSSQHFPNTIGWPITLILMGVLLLGFSGVIIKLNKKYM